MSLSIIKVNNPFDRTKRIIDNCPHTGQNITSIVKRQMSDDVNVFVSVNGGIIPKSEWDDVRPIDGETVLLVPVVEGGEDKGIWNMLAVLALTIAAVALGQYWVLEPIYMVAFVGAVSMTGGILINTLCPPPTEALPGPSDVERSQMHGWEPQTTQRQGLPIAMVYGRNKLFGNIISANSETTEENDGQILNLLCDFGYGPYKSISDIKINKQPITNFIDVDYTVRHGLLNQSVISEFDTIKIEYSIDYKVSYGTPYTYETTTDTFDELEIDIGFPGGLYKVNSNGGFVDHIVAVRIEYQYVGEGSWHILRAGAKKEITRIWLKHPNDMTPNWALPTIYPWIRVVGHNLTVDDEVLITDVVGMVELNKNTYNIKDKYGENWIQLDVDASGFTSYVSGGISQSTTAHITDYRSGNIKRTYKLADVVRGNKYNIKVTKLSEDEIVESTGEPNARFGDDVYLSVVRGVTNQALEYPRNALVGIKALATDQLSGSIGFSCIAECRFLRTYDGTNWGVTYSTNPAWVLFDIFTQPVFSGSTPYDSTASPPSTVTDISGNTDISVDGDTSTFSCSASGSSFANYTVGAWVLIEGLDYTGNSGYFEVTAKDAGTLTVDGTLTTEEEGATVSITQDPFVVERYDGRDPSALDLVKFKELSDFCDTLVGPSGDTAKRITFNGGFDQGTSVWQAALKICEVARCMPIMIGNKISLAIDKVIDTPVQIFNVGNIKKDSYKESFLSLEDRASELEIQYNDEDEDFERVPLTVVNPNTDVSENTLSLELFGITNATEAWGAGLYRLRKNQYTIRTVSFDTDVNAIASTIGSLIGIQHDVPQWGEGGMVVSATASVLTLDKAITEVADDYIFIRYADDSFETVAVTSVNSAGTEVTATFSPPIYSEGLVDVVIGDATVTGTGTFFTLGVAAGDSFSLAGSGDPSYTVLSVTDDTHLELTANYAETTDDDVTYEIQTIPHKNDLWIYGTITNVQKYYKIVNLEATQDQYISVSCVEYHAEVYDDDNESIIPVPPTIETVDNRVTNLALTEIVSLSDSGIINRQIEVTYVIPRTHLWQRAIIYYRIANLTNWNRAGETTSNSFIIPNVMTTTTYEIMVISVDLAGRYTDFASSPSEQITTGGNADYDGTYLSVKVTGLELEGQGNGIEFTGKDAKFVWHDIKIVSEVEYGAGEEPGGAGNTSANNWLKDYEVVIYDGDSNERRIIHVTEPRYTYAYEQNVEDGTGTPTREIEIQVRARDIYYRISEEPAKLEVSNPAPDAPANSAVTEYQQALDVTWDAVTDLDLMGYKVWVSTSGSFTPGSANLVYTGLGTRYIHQSTSYVAHYVRIAAYDAFGTTGLNYTAELSGTPTSPVTGELTDYDLDVPLTSGLVFATTDAGCTWTEGTMTYGGQSVTITAGAVATTDMYIYADLSGDSVGTLADPLTLSHSDVKPTIGQDKWLFAVVEYNADDDPDYTVFPAFGQRIIHAGLLQADTITADLIGAGEIKAGHLHVGSINASNIFVGGIVDSTALASAVTTSISTAQSTANTAVTNAATAQGTANANVTLLANIASDLKITPVEKLTLKPVWDAIETEATITTGTIIVQAAAFGVSSTTFAAAYATLYAYVITDRNIFNSMGATTNITRTTWDTDFNAYYDARTAILIAIADESKSVADTVASRVDGVLDTDDYLVSAMIATNTITMAGLASGLYADSTKMGYWKRDGSSPDWEGSEWKSYIDNTGNAVFSLSLTIGPADSDNSFRILVTAGVASAVVKRKSGTAVYMTVLDQDGLRSYYNATLDTFTGLEVSGNRTAYIGGLQDHSYFDRVQVDTLSVGNPAGDEPFNVGTSAGIFGVISKNTVIFYDANGEVWTPASSFSFARGSYAGRYYDSGWDNDGGAGYTGAASDESFAHGLVTIPSFYICFIRDHTTTSRQMIGTESYGDNRGTYIDGADATNIYVHKGLYEMEHADGNSTAVDIRVIAWK